VPSVPPCFRETDPSRRFIGFHQMAPSGWFEPFECFPSGYLGLMFALNDCSLIICLLTLFVYESKAVVPR